MPRRHARQMTLPFESGQSLAYASNSSPANPPPRPPVVLPTTASRHQRLRNEKVRALKALGAWWRDRR